MKIKNKQNIGWLAFGISIFFLIFSLLFAVKDTVFVKDVKTYFAPKEQLIWKMTKIPYDKEPEYLEFKTKYNNINYIIRKRYNAEIYQLYVQIQDDCYLKLEGKYYKKITFEDLNYKMLPYSNFYYKDDKGKYVTFDFKSENKMFDEILNGKKKFLMVNNLVIRNNKLEIEKLELNFQIYDFNEDNVQQIFKKVSKNNNEYIDLIKNSKYKIDL